MIKIFTVLKDGEVLKKEVLEGILKQSVECCLIPITSKGTNVYSENNRRNNVLRAIDSNTEDYFFMIDSDVVIKNTDLIKNFFDEEKNSRTKVRTATTKGENMNFCCYTPHALILIMNDEVKNFKKWMEEFELGDCDKKENCIICKYLKNYMKNNLVLTIQQNSTYETPRTI